MSPIFYRITFLAIALLPLRVAQAAFDPSIVGGDARWVVYADLNELRQSEIGKRLEAAIGEIQQNAVKEAPMDLRLNIPKVLQTVGTITAYGTNFSQDPKLLDGTLIVRGTTELPKIIEAILVQATITTPDRVTDAKGLPFTAYAISDHAKPATGETAQTPAAQLLVGFPSDSVVLLSKSREQLVKAHELLRGKAPSILKMPKAPLKDLVQNSKDAFVFAASVVPPEMIPAKDSPHARIVQMAESTSIGCGEANKMFFLRARLSASSDDNAEKLSKILQGLAAMASLAESNDESLRAFIESVTVSRQDRTVSLDMAYSSERLAVLIDKLKQTAERERAPAPQMRTNRGKVVAEWKTDDAVAEAKLIWQTVDNVELLNDSLVTLAVKRDGPKPVRIERLEIVPAGGGAGLSFRADRLKLNGFRTDDRNNKKRVLATESSARAELQFPGSDGTYTLKVGYWDEPEVKGSFTLYVRGPNDPTRVPVETKADDDSGKRGAR